MTGARRLLLVAAYLLDPAFVAILLALSSFVHRQHSVPGMDSLLDEYRSVVLREMEHVISPQLCAVVEKDCNFGIFNKALESEKTGEDVGIFRKAWGRLVFDANLTERYLDGGKMPSAFGYVLFSPYLSTEDFGGCECFHYTYSVEDRFAGKVKEIFYKILDALKDSQLDELQNDLVGFRREVGAHSTYYEFSLLGCGQYIATELGEEPGEGSSEIMRDLLEIKERIRALKGRVSQAGLVNEATSMLLEMLRMRGILKAGVDLEEFPDVVSVLFPYKMLDLKYGTDAHQLMTIGVDLTNIGGSFGQFFSLKSHPQKYYVTFDI